MNPRPHFQKLVERVRLLPPLRAAVVMPLDRDSLQLALSAAFAGYVVPTLVGPEQRIRDAANRAGLDISRLDVLDTPDEPRAASQRAAELGREGIVGALIRGSLSIEDLLTPVAAPDTGLRTERRLSHATFLDLPGQSRFLVVADAMLNVAPNLAAKQDIVRNTIRFALALGVAMPHVALLAAKRTIAPAFASTSEAAALKSMAAQGAFDGAIVDGPMTPDVAISAEAARQHGVKSEVAGRADVLIAPSMEAATMVTRTMIGLAGGLAAGLVLGARIPVVLASASDAMDVRVASCVLAQLMSRHATGSADAQRPPSTSEAAAAAAA
jgi:phosphate acetyltransferase